MKVLIADDNQVNSDLLKAQLESEGHTVFTAVDGIGAYTAMRENGQTPDLIIADAKMPRVDGYTFLSMVRNSEKYKSIPFILYSAYFQSKSNEVMAYELGANRYVRKSGLAREILDAVHTLVK